MTSLPTPPPTGKRVITSLAAETQARRKLARVAGVGGEGGLTRPSCDGLEWGCGARGDGRRPRLMKRRAVKEVCGGGHVYSRVSHCSQKEGKDDYSWHHRQGSTFSTPAGKSVHRISFWSKSNQDELYRDALLHTQLWKASGFYTLLYFLLFNLRSFVM